MPEQRIRVLIVADDRSVRTGLRSLLHRSPELEVVGVAASGEEAVVRARELGPDVIVMDVGMRKRPSVEASRAIRTERPDTKVILLMSYPGEEATLLAALAGASGYVLKEIGTGRLLSAVRLVARGGSLLEEEQRSNG